MLERQIGGFGGVVGVGWQFQGSPLPPASSYQTSLTESVGADSAYSNALRQALHVITG